MERNSQGDLGISMYKVTYNHIEQLGKGHWLVLDLITPEGWKAELT